MLDQEKKPLEENGDTLAPSEVETDIQQEPTSELEQVEQQEQQPMKDEQSEPVAPVEDEQQPMENGLVDQPTVDENTTPAEQMFSQSQLNDIVGRTRQEARDKAMRGLYDKYGVDGDEALDGIFGKGQAYDILNDNFNSTNQRLTEALTENALLKSGIDQARWDDAKLILGGKGMEVTEENIALELATHPEWKAVNIPNQFGEQGQQGQPLSPDMAEKMANMPQQNVVPEQPSQIRKFGSDLPESNETENEDEIVNKLFGL